MGTEEDREQPPMRRNKLGEFKTTKTTQTRLENDFIYLQFYIFPDIFNIHTQFLNYIMF